MKTKLALIKGAALLLLLSTLNSQLSTWAQGTAFTYQGRLTDTSSPANGSYDLRFTVYDALTGGSAVGGPLTNTSTAVSNGVFTVVLDFGTVFPGANRWLEIAARTNGNGGFSVLSPRQPLTAAPYAVTAGTVTGVVPGAGLSGTYGGPVTFNNTGNSFSGNGSGLVDLNANNLASGTVPSAALNNAWKTTGNTGASPTNGNFIGTTDFQPLELWVNQSRALRLEPDSNNFGAPNVIGGSPANLVDPGIYGATIAGGGVLNYTNIGYPPVVGSNRVSAVWGTIGGGLRNTVAGNHSTIGGGSDNFIGAAAYDSVIGGGEFNVINNSNSQSVIAGGNFNQATGVAAAMGGGSDNIVAVGVYGTVSGGYANIVSNTLATVAGGFNNTVNGYAASVSGGYINSAAGEYASIPGGYHNSVTGNSGFAAGNRAQALHDGTFVWSDATGAPFSSTGSNQFLVRAAGGVGIGTASPQAQLQVTGGDANQLILQNSSDSRYWSVYDENFNGSGALIFQPNKGVGAYIQRTDGNYVVNSDERLKRDIAPLGSVLDRVLQLRPVSYCFKSAPEGTPLSLGLIAQEVKPLFPDVVGERNGMMSLAYTELVPVTIRAIQELNQKLEQERAENAELKERLEALEKIVHSQKSN
jgi:hypothetical protein